ncbi:MAG: LuxR family transcriptional regulator [Magnetospirillum sp.]|nr:LuxR family transcriptional regulator [Magnetospirillum sp.]
MGSLHDPVETLAVELAGIRDSEHRRRTFLTHAAEFGVLRIAYVNTAPSRQSPYIETDYPAEWVRRYLEQGYADVDAVVLEGQRSPLPFHWRTALARPDYGATAERVFHEAAAFAIHDGFSVPVHGPGGFAMLSMVVDDPSLFQPNGARRRQTLHLMAMHFHLSCERALGAASQPAVQLTPREREVLLWTAKGKTGWEISQLLRLAERTVTFHMENARAKLGASSRSHAVVKAVTLGLIDP